MGSRNFSRGFVRCRAGSNFGNNSFHNTTSFAKELARFRGREANAAGDRFLIAFDGPGRAHPLWDEHLAVRSLGIDTVSRPSSRNSWSEGARVDENSRLKFVSAHPWQQPGSVRASVTNRTS